MKYPLRHVSQKYMKQAYTTVYYYKAKVRIKRRNMMMLMVSVDDVSMIRNWLNIVFLLFHMSFIYFIYH
jgi:tRNA threonylcarbamoyladenosine modification (KEOPS) complex  Pcc1 subunit